MMTPGKMPRIAEPDCQFNVVQEREAAARLRVEQLVRANCALADGIAVLVGDSPVNSMLIHTLRSICEQQAERVVLASMWRIDRDRSIFERHLIYRDGEVSTEAKRLFANDGARPLDPVVHPAGMRQKTPSYLLLDDMRPDIAAFLRTQGFIGTISFPMYVGDKPLGAFIVCFREALPPLETEPVLLSQTMAHQAALALHLTWLSEDTQRSAIARERDEAARMRVDELVQANRALKRSVDILAQDEQLETRLHRVMEVLAAQVDARSVHLCSRIEGTRQFDFHMSLVDQVAEPAPSEALSWPAALDWVWSLLIDSLQPILIDESRSDGTSPSIGTATRLVLPLIQDSEVVGGLVFILGRSIAVSAEQLEVLKTLGHQATLAIRFEQVSRIAQERSGKAATSAERTRIARDLHDMLAQGLTGIVMHLQASQAASDEIRARQHVSEALDAARGALIDARRSVHALRSIATNRDDFATVLRAVLKTAFASSAVASDVDGRADLTCVSEAAEHELLRIAQEAATNTLRHARATRFVARISEHRKIIRLVFEDDGVGFDRHRPSDGFGLVGIRERAGRAGARVRIASRIGKGTRIELFVPTMR